MVGRLQGKRALIYGGGTGTVLPALPYFSAFLRSLASHSRG